jgi:hypothetical protein
VTHSAGIIIAIRRRSATPTPRREDLQETIYTVNWSAGIPELLLHSAGLVYFVLLIQFTVGNDVFVAMTADVRLTNVFKIRFDFGSSDVAGRLLANWMWTN